MNVSGGGDGDSGWSQLDAHAGIDLRVQGTQNLCGLTVLLAMMTKLFGEGGVAGAV